MRREAGEVECDPNSQIGLLRMSSRLVIGQRTTSSPLRSIRCTGSGNATSGETTMRPFGWILTDGFRGNPRSSVSSAARIVCWRSAMNTSTSRGWPKSA